MIFRQPAARLGNKRKRCPLPRRRHGRRLGDLLLGGRHSVRRPRPAVRHGAPRVCPWHSRGAQPPQQHPLHRAQWRDDASRCPVAAARRDRHVHPRGRPCLCAHARLGWLLRWQGVLGWWNEAPWDVLAYAKDHSTYPCDSTLEQLHDSEEFEAYRELGEAAAAAAGRNVSRP